MLVGKFYVFMFTGQSKLQKLYCSSRLPDTNIGEHGSTVAAAGNKAEDPAVLVARVNHCPRRTEPRIRQKIHPIESKLK